VERFHLEGKAGPGFANLDMRGETGNFILNFALETNHNGIRNDHYGDAQRYGEESNADNDPGKGTLALVGNSPCDKIREIQDEPVV
jgi:hypothetical protein